MKLGFIGGVRCRAGNEPGGAPSWRWTAGAQEFWLRVQGGCQLYTWESLALLIRGYVRDGATAAPLDMESVAEELRGRYLEQGDLAVSGLEGNFTLVLLDGQARRIFLYRNLIGSGFTYFQAHGQDLLFGSNLAELLSWSPQPRRPSRELLPTFFLARTTPARDTLFEGIHRLLPGEQLLWDRGCLRQQQRQTFADLRGGRPLQPEEALDQLEETMPRVLADCRAHRPATANLLSGGVDSCYLQAVWNHVAGDDLQPPSYSVSVDHPRTWPDTDYAVSAAGVLGTRHQLVAADGRYGDYLLDLLSSTAEPPNHVQAVYFGMLARTMVSQRVGCGLCGEGADSLFGLGLANQLDNAGLLRTLVPFGAARQAGAWLARLVGWPRLAATFRLASGLTDYDDLQHPINEVAHWTDPDAVRACFGDQAIRRAAARRRELLGVYQVPDNPHEAVHAVSFLGEGVDSAALWTTLFNASGADLLCPYLDSRVVRLVMRLAPQARFPFRRPKELLKRALARHVPRALAYRPKLGFGQPIMEWLAPGGQLRSLVDDIQPYEFVDRPTLERARARPSWFLYSLLCYDLWHKLFIEGRLPRQRNTSTLAAAPAWVS